MPHPKSAYDPVSLEVFKCLFSSIPEEMGVVLRRSSYSPNIKERRDYSCAVFNSSGLMIAQAAHIPVHLGSMPLSVHAAIDAHLPTLQPGDTIMLNDPYKGGTHLPDITLVSPVYHKGHLVAFVASRAHHADVGGSAPGSMSIAKEIFQEGLIIPPVKLFNQGILSVDVLSLVLANVRTPLERQGDIFAQIAANQRGQQRTQDLLARYGQETVEQQMDSIIAYTARLTRSMISGIPDGTYRFTDYLDDDGVNFGKPVPISVAITINGSDFKADFSGSSSQVTGSLNAVYAITLSAVFYVLRCLLDMDVPTNTGSLDPVSVIAPSGTVINSTWPAPVAGGNVETSQRIVDVLMGALHKALPDRIPAASQGTMNNLTIGGWDPFRHKPFTYYETIAGGHGASDCGPGAAAMHSHMTNTLNTPIEALEHAYPLRVLRYEIREHSGGSGRFPGGDGVCRELQLCSDARVSMISERRKIAPYGLRGGMPGDCGINIRVCDGKEYELPSKFSLDFTAGDALRILTPGGGGMGIMSAE